MQKLISVEEGFLLMSDRDHEILHDRLHEMANSFGISYSVYVSNYDHRFIYDESVGELFYELVNSDGDVMYRLMFKIKKSIGRPSLGVTKKVSLTLPVELWEKIDEYQKDLSASRSETFRTILDEFFSGIERGCE